MLIGRRAAAWAVFALAALPLVGGTGGCRGRAAGVPEAAEFEKASKRIRYTAPRDGTVYVVDDWYNRLVYSGPLRQGDQVLVDPGAGTLTVAGKDVRGGRKLTNAEHSIYTEPAGSQPR